MTANLSKRMATLEAEAVGAVTLRDAIDRPPRETREEWIARQAGLPPPYPPRRTSSGETRDEWIARRERELAERLTPDAERI
jgi:hypothetical protein